MTGGHGRTIEEALDPAFAQVLDTVVTMLPFILGIAGVHIVWKLAVRFLREGAYTAAAPKGTGVDPWTAPRHRAAVGEGARPCDYGLECLCERDPDEDRRGGCGYAARVRTVKTTNGAEWRLVDAVRPEPSWEVYERPGRPVSELGTPVVLGRRRTRERAGAADLFDPLDLRDR